MGAQGLTANLIAPGYIAETDFFHGQLSEQRRTALIDATHNKRPGHPNDIAETTYFMASDGARHITGQIVHVNGGPTPPDEKHGQRPRKRPGLL